VLVPRVADRAHNKIWDSLLLGNKKKPYGKSHRRHTRAYSLVQRRKFGLMDTIGTEF